MDLYSSILLLMLSIFHKEVYSSITWYMTNPAIVFGGDVLLFCNASFVENCCTNTATWMKDFDVIVHHGASVDSTKYTEKQHSDGFSLVIKRFDKDDINHQFTCLYDFFSYSAVLTINKTNYKYMPNENETQSNITMTNTLIFAEIMFDIIYPSPDCVLVVNGDKMATNVTVSDKILTRLFYKLRLRLVCEILRSVCIESIAINCTVEGEDVQYVDHTNMSNCLDVTTSFNFTKESESLQKTVLLIFFICFATCCIAVFTCVVRWKRQRNRNQNDMYVEGGLHSTNYVNGRLRISQCYMNEEFELLPLITEQVQSGIDRLRSYPNQMLMKLFPYIESKSKNLNLIIETLSSHLEDWKSLYAAWCAKTCRKTNPTDHHILKDTKRTNRDTPPPAQKKKDVTRQLGYDILHDTAYIQRLTTDTGINLARHRLAFTELNFFTYYYVSAKQKGRSDIAWVTCPAQKDVNKMVHYAILFDKAYIQILVTNTRIHSARLQKAVQREVQSSYESGHQGTNYDTRTHKFFTSSAQTMDDYHAVRENVANQMQIDKHKSAVIAMNCSIDSTWLTCPAQKETDVIRLINYAKQHDTIYMQILVTNERINFVRLQYSQTK